MSRHLQTWTKDKPILGHSKWRPVQPPAVRNKAFSTFYTIFLSNKLTVTWLCRWRRKQSNQYRMSCLLGCTCGEKCIIQSADKKHLQYRDSDKVHALCWAVVLWVGHMQMNTPMWHGLQQMANFRSHAGTVSYYQACHHSLVRQYVQLHCKVPTTLIDN